MPVRTTMGLQTAAERMWFEAKETLERLRYWQSRLGQREELLDNAHSCYASGLHFMERFLAGVLKSPLRLKQLEEEWARSTASKDDDRARTLLSETREHLARLQDLCDGQSKDLSELQTKIAEYFK